MTDLGWTGLRSACGQDLSFDGARFDEWEPPRPTEPKPPVVHDVTVGLDEIGLFGGRTWIGWCRTCHAESLPSSRSAAEAWAVVHRGGAEQ